MTLEQNTLLIEDLNSIIYPSEKFAIRISTDVYTGYELHKFAAGPLTALLAYDAFFEEKHSNRRLLNKHASKLDPALRGNDTFSSDFFPGREADFSETAIEEPWTLSDDEVYHPNTLKVGIVSHRRKSGGVVFSNGKHNTRAFYSFGIKEIPLSVEKTGLPSLQTRVSEIGYRMEQGKTLFPLGQVFHDFKMLKVPVSVPEFKENALFFLRFATARRPDDLFLNRNEFKIEKKSFDYGAYQ